MPDRTVLERMARSYGYEPSDLLPEHWVHYDHPTTHVGWSLVAREMYQRWNRCQDAEHPQDHWYDSTEPCTECACGDWTIYDDYPSGHTYQPNGRA